ncbi:MAG TPA: MFS transporter [Bacteroidota bacterium]|nr:MFS transporter [Bacteroidota bacterium]
MTGEQKTNAVGSSSAQNWLNRNVIGMGITSFLSDASHEMATAVLPGFLTVIGAPPSALGFIEGTADALSSFVKLWSGWISDRLGRRKTFATAGYFLTGIAMAAFAFASTWVLVLIARIVGWVGRGFRGPIRDAMLADSVDVSARGKAFGIHRAGDTLGAIIGPLLGVWLFSVWRETVSIAPSRPFRNIFLMTLLPGILSAIVFYVTVIETPRAGNPRLQFWGTVQNFPRRFKAFLIGVGVFGLGDFAPTFLILAATTILQPKYGIMKAAQLAGLMYVVRNVTYAGAAYPIGALSDHVGRKAILIGGYALGTITIAGFAAAFIFNCTNLVCLFTLFGSAGIFIASEDTLESAMTADFISTETRGIGMGVLGTVNGLGDFGSSIIVGLLWATISPVAAFAFAASVMALGTGFLMYAQ